MKHLSLSARSERTTVTVDKESLQKLARYARARGLTLYTYVSRILSAAADIAEGGLCPLDLLTYMKFYRVLIPLEPVPVPLSFLLDLVESIDVDKFAEKAKQLGRRTGLVLSKLADIGFIIRVIPLLREVGLIKDGFWRRISDNVIEVVIIGSSGSEKGAALMKEFVRGLLEALGVDKSEILTRENMIEIRMELPKEIVAQLEEVLLAEEI